MFDVGGIISIFRNEKKGNYIANRVGLKNGVIVNSGTIAILSALKILDIKSSELFVIDEK